MHLKSVKCMMVFIGMHMQLHYLPVSSKGTVTIRFVRFVNPSLSTISNKCCESGFLWQCRTNACDPAFSICMSSNITEGNCSMGQMDSSATHDTDSITFGTTIGNSSNPITFKFTRWTTPAKLSIRACNNVCIVGSNDQLIDEYSYTLGFDPEPNGQHNHQHSILKIGRLSRFEIQVHIHCDLGYYGDCTRFCEPHPYRYKCDCTGYKICEEGWTGDNCDQNINDCAGNQCQNNAVCRDGFSTYYCMCQHDFTGRYCEHNINKLQQMNLVDPKTTPQTLASLQTVVSTNQIIGSSDKYTASVTYDKQENTASILSFKTSDSRIDLLHTTQMTSNPKAFLPSSGQQNKNSQLLRSGNNEDENSNMILPPGGVVGIAVSIVALVLVSVIVVKLVRWCRMKDRFVMNDGSSTSSEGMFDNEASQSEWMYYRT